MRKYTFLRLESVDVKYGHGMREARLTRLFIQAETVYVLNDSDCDDRETCLVCQFVYEAA